jgi:Protein of unknown function (DUF3237)
MINYKLDHMFSFAGQGAAGTAPEALGALPEGFRVNFYLAGGEVGGPAVRGKLRPVGGDWMTVRRDGVAIVDARATIETEDGALIFMTYPGMIDLGEDGFDRFQRGELAPVVQIRIAPKLSTAHAKYLWMNRLQYLGIGEYRPAMREARYDVYAVR